MLLFDTSSFGKCVYNGRGTYFVVLGIIMYLAYDNKKRLILSYMIFVVVYMFLCPLILFPLFYGKSRN